MPSKLLFILAALAVVLAVPPTAVMASGGSGSSDSTWSIASQDQQVHHIKITPNDPSATAYITVAAYGTYHDSYNGTVNLWFLRDDHSGGPSGHWRVVGEGSHTTGIQSPWLNQTFAHHNGSDRNVGTLSVGTHMEFPVGPYFGDHMHIVAVTTAPEVRVWANITLEGGGTVESGTPPAHVGVTSWHSMTREVSVVHGAAGAFTAGGGIETQDTLLWWINHDDFPFRQSAGRLQVELPTGCTVDKLWGGGQTLDHDVSCPAGASPPAGARPGIWGEYIVSEVPGRYDVATEIATQMPWEYSFWTVWADVDLEDLERVQPD